MKKKYLMQVELKDNQIKDVSNIINSLEQDHCREDISEVYLI